jgi:hypothetical protein
MTRVAIIGGIGGRQPAEPTAIGEVSCLCGLRRLGTYDQACGSG